MCVCVRAHVDYFLPIAFFLPPRFCSFEPPLPAVIRRTHYTGNTKKPSKHARATYNALYREKRNAKALCICVFIYIYVYALCALPYRYTYVCTYNDIHMHAYIFAHSEGGSTSRAAAKRERDFPAGAEYDFSFTRPGRSAFHAYSLSLSPLLPSSHVHTYMHGYIPAYRESTRWCDELIRAGALTETCTHGLAGGRGKEQQVAVRGTSDVSSLSRSTSCRLKLRHRAIYLYVFLALSLPVARGAAAAAAADPRAER